MTSRYHGHLALSQFDDKSQARLESACVMVVGLGGVGCPAAQYLAAAGVGRLVLCDFDRVSESNLTRQILYRESDVGALKVTQAAKSLHAMNSAITVDTCVDRINAETANEVGANCQLWIDTSDNWATRMAINEAALASGTPWVMAAAIRREGQLALFRPVAGGACYSCLYADAANTMDNCAGAGIMSTVAGSVGIAAAHLALTFLTGGEVPATLNLFDGQSLAWQSLAASADPSCRVCQA
ncbi:MAG: ThiF family adenylyltransferase [Lysobacterales bacterium]